MIRKLLGGMAAMAAGLALIGCDDAKSTSGGTPNIGGLTKKMDDATNQAKDTVDKAKADADKAEKEAKESVLKPITDMYPKIEEKMKTLTGDKLKDATAKFDELKKVVESFKTAAPDKIAAAKTQMTKLFAELKEMLGL